MAGPRFAPRALGIDFGTTKSVLGYAHAGEPAIISDREGHSTFPSVVMVDPDGDLYVSWEAVRHPDRYRSTYLTVSSIKRVLGDNGSFASTDFSLFPHEAAALLLGYLRLVAEDCYQTKVAQAVLAVPASFGSRQHAAIQDAAHAAGLEVLRTIYEPTAAVLAFCESQDVSAHRQGTSTLLVFDFGGGTLDVSVVKAGEGVYEVIFSAGDTGLGGDDFDNVIASYALQRTDLQYGTRLSEIITPVHSLLLRQAVEQAKKTLSHSSTAVVHIPGFVRSQGGYWPLHVELDRLQFERMCKPLFTSVFDVLSAIPREIRHAIDEIIMIGGSSQIPYVREMVETFVGTTARGVLGQDSIVARGASLQAGCLTGEVRDILLLDVMPSSFLAVVNGSKPVTVVPAHTMFPASESKRLEVEPHDREWTEIEILTDEGTNGVNLVTFGHLRLPCRSGCSNGPSKSEIVVTVDIDANRVASAKAKDITTGQGTEAILLSPFHLNPAQMSVLTQKTQHQMELIASRGELYRPPRRLIF